MKREKKKPFGLVENDDIHVVAEKAYTRMHIMHKKREENIRKRKSNKHPAHNLKSKRERGGVCVLLQCERVEKILMVFVAGSSVGRSVGRRRCCYIIIFPFFFFSSISNAHFSSQKATSQQKG